MLVCNFPEDFLWGAATSAYQIEGSIAVDGRGESIWDRFVQQPGAVHNNETGATACDHYRLWRDDIALMRDLNLRSYRFSIAWPRVIPAGRGRPNGAGLDFYDRLVDGLLEAGIEPLATLYHWDLPAALQEEGGWANRETSYRFRDYAAHVFERLGDRVGRWLTVNEPWVAAMVGHAMGVHAPGMKDGPTAVQTTHHLLLAHGLAVEAFDELGLRNPDRDNGPARIGLALDIHAYGAASDTDVDREAMERARTLEARWFLEPVFAGAYPDEGLQWYERHGAVPTVYPGDMEQIARPIDILAINYYRRHVVKHDATVPLFQFRHEVPAGKPVTEMGWEVYPEGLYDVLRWVWDFYASQANFRGGLGDASGSVRSPGPEHSPVSRNAPSLLVTENGASYPDTLVNENGTLRVRDDERGEYLHSHLYHMWRAIQDGVPVEGYYAWSLLDNFEWAEGYSKRFGIVYVDYDTQRRVVKDSGRSYAEVARQNALTMERA